MTLTFPSLTSLWQNFRLRWYFKFTLPAKTRATLHGVELDISMLSSIMKNNILEGRYEFQECRLARRCLNSNDVVLELGGAIGFIGLFCRKVIGVRHHLTVEANPATIEILQRNYRLNSMTPEVVHAAAAAADGEISLDVGGEFWENSIVSRQEGGKKIQVPSRSLHSLSALLPEKPTVLICDIEGAETHLDFSQLPSTVTRMIIELHPSMVGEAAVNDLVEKFHNLGFRTETVEENTWLFVR
ncbi:FkbM family methyltransferase [Prosthecobacter vanneervenii]|uniref:FkbM family methyltransferase n=1 Tax=Prosthecobacter vanneervenii TaxID=48466 RepID=A0A7W7Y9X7_9BACT|nr:FkbM family methyltransferase [Prosthecobacter vanneervenii]MBB5032214.1 FkbM family methyltransferase [Prosthecobacter vanneervenii]